MDLDAIAENSPCFVRAQASQFTGPLQESARPHQALALGLTSMGKSTWSSINYNGRLLPIDDVIADIPKWNTGFKTEPVKVGGAGVMITAVVVEMLPELLYPKYPELDRELLRVLSVPVAKTRDLPETLPRPQPQPRSAPSKTHRVAKGKLGRSSQIWAKSQGNTILNSLHDYRYRPSFGGIRL